MPWLGTPPRRRTKPWAYATLAMLLGAASLLVALVEPSRAGVPTGFVVSSIGITAVVVGIRTVRMARWGSATARAFGRGGAILGGAGTALMLYAVIAVGLATVEVQLPALTLPMMQTGPEDVVAESLPVSPQQTAPSTAAAAGSDAVPVAPAFGDTPASREAEQSSVAQAAGTMAFAMRQRFGDGPFPPTLVVSTDAPQRVMLADGSGLAAVPSGAKVLYSVSADRSAWSVTVIGATFGTVASYSSSVGTVQVG